MTDDIVTRLRIESASSVDVIRRLDMKCLCCPCCEESCLYCETVGELNEAADEIERLRTELQHSALQTNVMRNIATTPFGDAFEQIADLEAELAEFQRQYLVLKKDRDRWAKWGEHVFTCPNKGINPCRDCVSPATADAMSRVDRGEAWHV